MSPSAVDALIIGGGPAGMSAALAFARQGQTATIFDHGKYRNNVADYMHLIPGLDHIPPASFRDTARSNMTARYDGIQIEAVEIVSACQQDAGGFQVSDDLGKIWVGKKMVLAMGVEDVMPDIPGYAQCWGKSIFHCLYCKGFEQRGESAGVLAIGGLASVPQALHVARQASALSKIVTLYTNGSEPLATLLTESFGVNRHMRVDHRRIKELLMGPNDRGVSIHFQDGSEVLEPYLAHQPATQSRNNLADQLCLEKTPSGDMKVTQPFQQTSVRGIFASGDNGAMLKNIPNAIFTGHIAGQMASTQLLAELNGQKSMFPL